MVPAFFLNITALYEGPKVLKKHHNYTAKYQPTIVINKR